MHGFSAAIGLKIAQNYDDGFQSRPPAQFTFFNTLACEVLIGNSTGLCWPEGTTIQQGYSV